MTTLTLTALPATRQPASNANLGGECTMRILLVEDENRTAAYLRKGLMENGFAVDVARQNGNLTELAGRAGYDLLVCDGGGRGRRFQEFSGIEPRTPVLFLTTPDGAPEQSA